MKPDPGPLTKRNSLPGPFETMAQRAKKPFLQPVPATQMAAPATQLSAVQSIDALGVTVIIKERGALGLDLENGENSAVIVGTVRPVGRVAKECPGQVQPGMRLVSFGPAAGPQQNVDQRAMKTLTAVARVPRPISITFAPPAEPRDEMIEDLIDDGPGVVTVTQQTRTSDGMAGRAPIEITGDTRPVKDTLKSIGARWSSAHTCWLFTGKSRHEIVALVLSAGIPVAGEKVPSSSAPFPVLNTAGSSTPSPGTVPASGSLWAAVDLKPGKRSKPPVDLKSQLKSWRTEKVKEKGVPAYQILTNACLDALVAHPPCSVFALQSIKGIGKAKVSEFGDELLQMCSGGAYDDGPQAKRVKMPAEHEPSLTAEQEAVARRARAGENLFLTGPAGTGKSFLLRSIVQQLRKLHSEKAVAVTAPTVRRPSHDFPVQFPFFSE